jgi:hypothetical protein
MCSDNYIAGLAGLGFSPKPIKRIVMFLNFPNLFIRSKPIRIQNRFKLQTTSTMQNKIKAHIITKIKICSGMNATNIFIYLNK